MNELDRFFQNEVKAYEEELNKIDKVFADVLPTFTYRQITHCRCSDKECKVGKCSDKERKVETGCDMRECQYSFAYEITQHGEESSCLVHNWSTSTNAMMLNIVSYLQETEFNSLFVKGSRSLTIPQNLRHKIKEIDTNQIYTWLEKCFLKKHSNREGALSKGFHDSRSYGTNPWCTLAWFGEIILFRKLKNQLLDSDTIDLWCKIVAERFQKHLEREPQRSFEEGISGMRAAICYKTLEKLYNLDNENDDLKKRLTETQKSVSDRLRPILLQRIYQHITSFEISDGLFDPGELAFSMEGLVLLDDGRHYLQEAILERFYKVMTVCLNRDVFWRATKPVNIGSQGGVILPISAEVASSLLRTCHMVSKDPQHLKCFRKHREVFSRYTHWVLSQKVEVCSKTSFIGVVFDWLCYLFCDTPKLLGISEGKSNKFQEIFKKKPAISDDEIEKLNEIEVDVNKILNLYKKNIVKVKKEKIKDDLFILFPFFSPNLRQNLFFELEKSSSSPKIKVSLKSYSKEILPLDPIAITLNLLIHLLDKKSISLQEDENPILKIEINSDLEDRLKERLGDEIGTKLYEFICKKKINSKKSWHGWHSEHTMRPLYNSRFIHLWATREYFIYLMQYRAMLCSDMAWELIERNDFKVDHYKPPKYYLDRTEVQKWDPDAPVPPSKYWKKTVITGFETLRGSRMKELSVFDAIKKEFFKGERKNPDECAWSMLLYGPPGTGKSTIAEKLAEALGWPLITITPSDFIRQGEAQVEARAKQIFRSLMLQQDAVVLFDEIDRLLLDRDAPMYFDQHDTFQFMTPGMLVKLKDLWCAKRVIFIICTNYDERIDMAAKRRGRIDHSFLVLPPDGLGRMMIIIRELLKGHPDIKKIIEKKPDIKDKFALNVVKIVSSLEKNEEDKTQIEEELKELIKNTSGFAVEDMKTVAEKLLENADIASEIKSISEALVENRKDFNGYDELKKIIENKSSILNNFNELDPAQIRLESYLHRFRDLEKENKNGHVTIQTSQQPFDEIIGLIALIVNDEKKLVESCQKDPSVRNTIMRMLNNLAVKELNEVVDRQCVENIYKKISEIKSFKVLYLNGKTKKEKRENKKKIEDKKNDAVKKSLIISYCKNDTHYLLNFFIILMGEKENAN